MKLLAIDTAANLCAACVFDSGSGNVAATRSLDVGRGHVELLMPLVGELMAEAGCAFRDLSRIAVNVGPGSFTGVRVGVAAARGFALALDIPAVGVSALEAIAAEARTDFPGRPVLVVLDARREEVYSALHDASGARVDGPEVSTVEACAAIAGRHRAVLAGSAAAAVAQAAGGAHDFGPLGATAAIETFARLAATAEAPSAAPKPLYLRAPDARPQTGFAVARAGR
ncbi:MAG: tRNA (adenosine(37)-N6)-threonylcarbamoyltransferase complex dimerization subunit type 1 TsaB [Rhizobiaceae bacterium]